MSPINRERGNSFHFESNFQPKRKTTLDVQNKGISELSRERLVLDDVVVVVVCICTLERISSPVLVLVVDFVHVAYIY